MSVGAEDTFANDLYTICWGSVELRPLIPKGVGILRGKRDRGRDHDPEGQICGRQPDQPRQSRFSAFPCDDQRPANAGLLLAPPLPCHRGIRLFGAALSWLERCRHGAEPQSRLAFQTAKRSVFVALSLKQPCKELNARMIAAKPILCASQRKSPDQDPLHLLPSLCWCCIYALSPIDFPAALSTQTCTRIPCRSPVMMPAAEWEGLCASRLGSRLSPDPAPQRPSGSEPFGD